METNESEIYLLIGTFAIIFLALGIFLILFYFLYKNKQKLHKMKITALNHELLQTQVEIQERTLKMVSQEIHDNIGQVLSLAKLNLNTFVNITDENIRSKLSDTKELVSKAINDLRDLARSMHGDKIAEIGLQNAVDNELKILQNTGQFRTHLTITGDAYKLKPQVQTVVFRIIQETLHNDIKHSKAKNIFVHFNYEPSAFELVLKDDGIGFNLQNLKAVEKGIGLKSMEDRASLIGAEFSINSVLNKGTIIRIKVPKGMYD